MPEEIQGASADSPQPDAGAVPSAAAEGASSEQVSGEGTPPSTQPEPTKPWNMPPEERWEELRREREEYKRAYQELAAKVSQSTPGPAPVTPQADPWEGLINHPDPATAQFYQQQKRLVEHAVQQGRDQAFRELQPVLSSLQQGQADITLKEFRKENPDIKPGSEEERLVVAYMSGQVDGTRHPIESAKRNVLYGRLEAENRALKSKQTSVQAKVAANVSEASSGIPPTTGLPRKPGDWRENVKTAFRKGGSLADILNAAGASRAPTEG